MIFVVPGLIRFVRVVPVDTFFEAAVDVLPGDAGVLSPGDVGGLVGFEQGFADITQEEVGENGGIFEGRAVNAWKHGSVRADVGVIAAEDDAFKLVATSECSCSYARHPLRQTDACQGCAVIECFISYICQALRQADTCQRCAGKCALSYTYQSLRQADAYEGCAVGECHFSYTCHSLRQADACKGFAKVECFFSYAFQSLRQVDV